MASGIARLGSEPAPVLKTVFCRYRGGKVSVTGAGDRDLGVGVWSGRSSGGGWVRVLHSSPGVLRGMGVSVLHSSPGVPGDELGVVRCYGEVMRGVLSAVPSGVEFERGCRFYRQVLSGRTCKEA